MNERLIDDAAMIMAEAILGLIASCIREEEHGDAVGEFYCICKAGIEAYEQQQMRAAYRWKPSRN
jgi:hypothetical protein